jgi:excisionase family DNA binding protein
MHVNVQRAARRLGVSPVTIRRWTATGFLPCIRTPGGHRRIDTDDLDELARTIASDSALAAKIARERDLETVADASVSLGSKHELRDLLSEIASQVTRVLECDACVIYEHVPAERLARVVADYERTGRRCPPLGPYRFSDFPLTGRVIEERLTVHVDVDDPAADAAEVAALRAAGDVQMLLMPLVSGDRSLGMLEAVWHQKTRRRTRQELRIAHAVADQAAMAIVNARALAAGRASDRRLARLQGLLRELRQALPQAAEAATADECLAALAAGVRSALDALSCVAAAGAVSAMATATDDYRGGGLHTTRATSSGYSLQLTLTVELRRAPDRGAADMLDLAADVGAALLATRTC